MLWAHGVGTAEAAGSVHADCAVCGQTGPVFFQLSVRHEVSVVGCGFLRTDLKHTGPKNFAFCCPVSNAK